MPWYAAICLRAVQRSCCVIGSSPRLARRQLRKADTCISGDGKKAPQTLHGTVRKKGSVAPQNKLSRFFAKGRCATNPEIHHFPENRASSVTISPRARQANFFAYLLGLRSNTSAM